MKLLIFLLLAGGAYSFGSDYAVFSKLFVDNHNSNPDRRWEVGTWTLGSICEKYKQLY